MEDPVKKSLPARPNLEHLRSQAKQLLARLRDGDAAAAQTFIDHLPAAKGMTPAQVRRSGLRLADAQSAVARRSGFAAWPGLARHVEQLRAWEGEWQFVSLEIDGNEMPAAMLTQSRLLVDGDRFRTESPESNYEGIFTLDVDADPPHIDIEFVEGPEAGQWSYGIYDIDGDQMRLCLGLAGASRPVRFGTAAGSGHALERLRRSSPARPQGVDGGTRQPIPTLPPVDESAFGLNMTPLVAALQGEWAPVSLVNNGQPFPAAMLGFGSRTLDGNELRVTFGGQLMVHAKIRIDEAASPVGVDYLNIGHGPKTVTLGIMAIEGDRIRVCMSAAGDPRPTDFSCSKGSGRTFSEWQRRAPGGSTSS